MGCVRARRGRLITGLVAGASRQAAGTSAAATFRVRQVIDGDTITVAGVGTVRLLGVDAPEKTGGYRASEPYGDEAARFLGRC